MSKTHLKVLALAFSKSLPIMCSYIFISIAYGITMQENGYAWYWSVCASAAIYSGALLFVVVSFLAGAAPLLTVAITSLLMSSRQCFYSLTFLDDIKRMGRKKLFVIHTMTDETYAVDCTLNLPDAEKEKAMFLIAIFCHASWLIGTAIGGIAGQFLPFELTGIDFCMTALFVTIFIGQWEKTKIHFPALSGLLIGVLCLFLLGANNFIMPALLISSAVLLLAHKEA